MIAGTRVPVDTLFEYLEAGRSLGHRGRRRVKVLLDEMPPIGMREMLPLHEVYSAAYAGFADILRVIVGDREDPV